MFYIVSHYYHPENNPPAARMGYLVGLLKKKYGLDQVKVLTGRPNHPDGKLAAGFRGKWFKKTVGPQGESIQHLYERPAPNRGFARKTFGFVTFSISVFFYFLFRRVRTTDIIFVTSPPIFSAYMLYVLSFVKPGLRYVVDIRDLMPETAEGMGVLDDHSWIYRFLVKLSNRTYRRACKGIGVVEGIVEHLDEASAPRKNHLVYNTVDTEFFRPLPESDTEAFRAAHPEYFPKGHTTFLFSGTLSVYMGLLHLLEAANLLRATHTEFRILIIGFGEQHPRLVDYIAEHDLAEWVHLLPYRPKDELLQFIATADICYVPTIDKKIFQMIIPTKLLEYMACNKFILSSLDCPIAHRLQAKGHTLNSFPEDAPALCENMKMLLDQPALWQQDLGARAFIEETFSLQAFEQRMGECLEEFEDSLK